MAFRDGGRLFVGNLNKEIKKQDIKLEFEKHGPVNYVWLSLKFPRFAFVEFENGEDAAKARTALNGQDLKGACIRVEFSREQIHFKKNRHASQVPNAAYSENDAFLSRGPMQQAYPMGNNNRNAPDRTPMFPLQVPNNCEVTHANNPTTFFRTRNFYNSNRFKSRNTGELNCSHSSENVADLKAANVQ